MADFPHEQRSAWMRLYFLDVATDIAARGCCPSRMVTVAQDHLGLESSHFLPSARTDLFGEWLPCAKWLGCAELGWCG